MSGRKRRGGFARFCAAAIGLMCALVLSVLFYGAVVYQLSDGGGGAEQEKQTATAAPLEQGVSVARMFPGALLALSQGELIQESAQDIRIGAQTCRVVTRRYLLEDGREVRAISASPADYLRRLSQEGYIPQLITGFLLAEMDAAYETRDEEGILIAGGGDYIYMIEGAADEEAMYELGAGAYLEE